MELPFIRIALCHFVSEAIERLDCHNRERIKRHVKKYLFIPEIAIFKNHQRVIVEQASSEAY